MGDLNLIFENDSRGAVPHTSSSNTSFTSSSRDSTYVNMIFEAGLEDMGYTGRSFTWSGNIHGTGIRRSRLDRALSNEEWVLSFSDAKLMHLPQLGSDHCPIMLDTSYSDGDRKRNWKYFQCYERDDTLKVEIVVVWNQPVLGSHSFQLSKKLVFARQFISKWNKEKFGNIQSNIHLLHHQLKQLQQNIQHTQNNDQVLEVEKQIEHWQHIQNEFWGQKSRDQYYMEMDRNTKFHHTNANRRRSRIHIAALKDSSGNWCTTRVELENLLVTHYSDIHTTSNPERNEDILNCIPQEISEEDNQMRISIPSA
ncbi:uncharacterized protein LOC113359115 [Papaver somniferum]|uniref:uncharacterized protein LOC113359115 n=1 Tax=Papaver somniferum TaxID=3469 RepID=UPI000E6F5515|nr:uncharacterized protein LOC113359115 [Papaver somniferum]